jgi:hypothetical protein
VHEAAVAPLTAWQNFYVIIGSAAAALTGLMFVVITLIAGLHQRRSGDSVAAFGTPTVVHFSASLLVAGMLSAPWQTLWHPGLLLALCGLGGVGYILVVIRRARRQTTYQPVLEDWLWHMIFPLIAYAALLVAGILIAGILLPGEAALALFGVGAATIFLLFIGIHNSWDTVTFLVMQEAEREDGKQD